MAETYSIECRHCGRRFDAPNRRHKVCSRECTLSAHDEKRKLEPRRNSVSYAPAYEKQCGYCGVTKPGEQFYRQRRHSSGLSYGCKPCASSAAKARIEFGRDAYLEARRQRYQANREDMASDSQRRYWANYAQARERAWRVAHGIEFTWDAYVALKESQGWRCAICERHESSLTKSLAVDHDHATGRVRGLLCDDCNLALGRFQDSPDVLRRAIDYLSA